jgi:YidC/Oxa1 family membrane protein insertase
VTLTLPFWVVMPNIALSPQQAWSKLGMLASIPYLILIVLFSASIYLPQQMIATDPQQKNIALIMAAVFVFIGWSVPAAVLLYWVVSSAWQVGQQWLTMRGLNRTEGAKAS